LPPEQRDSCVDRGHRAEQVCLDYGAVGLGVAMADRPRASDAGVSDHHVQATKGGGELVDRFGHLVIVGDVEAPQLDPAIRVALPDLPTELLEGV
jgi:hypothetical protein